MCKQKVSRAQQPCYRPDSCSDDASWNSDVCSAFCSSALGAARDITRRLSNWSFELACTWNASIWIGPRSLQLYFLCQVRSLLLCPLVKITELSSCSLWGALMLRKLAGDASVLCDPLVALFSTDLFLHLCKLTGTEGADKLSCCQQLSEAMRHL